MDRDAHRVTKPASQRPTKRIRMPIPIPTTTDIKGRSAQSTDSGKPPLGPAVVVSEGRLPDNHGCDSIQENRPGLIAKSSNNNSQLTTNIAPAATSNPRKLFALKPGTSQSARSNASTLVISWTIAPTVPLVRIL